MPRQLDILKPVAVWPGIYAVLCPPAQLIYVGQSKRAMHVRWSEHWQLLRLGQHPNVKMQAAWQLYGERTFDVMLLRVVLDIRELDAWERYWIARIGNANTKR